MSASSAPPPQQKLTAPYGSWSSPITSDIVSGAGKTLGGTAVDSLGHLFWLESRPTESGRSVIVRGGADEDEASDITPIDFSVRTVAQDYGGGDFSVSGDTVIFSNYKDQRLYKQSIRSPSSPVALTPDYGEPLVCYADGVFDKRFNRYVTIREDRRESSKNSVATIVSLELNDETIRDPIVLVGGNDFYAFPRLDHEGKRIAWIEWSHPNML
ncbi:unnamed protein product [Lactuca virosa]|uniref:Peptidase S9A N-terminal domain-containing protein n=1 Tax=Lactuca virosa TaxID=75947 RepID=A0AAU9PRB4_9ASTR|nr:unnamed protein product [Lactuca virosa]